MSGDTFERVTVGALFVFATAVGVLCLVGVLLALLKLAAETVTAIAAAGPAGIGLTLALRRKGK